MLGFQGGVSIPLVKGGVKARPRSASVEPGRRQGLDALTTSPLPAISDPVIIDGTSQPGYSGTPLVELYGGTFGGTGSCDGTGLGISAGNSTVRGLMINAWSAAIVLSGNGNNVVQGNYLGLDASGKPTAG